MILFSLLLKRAVEIISTELVIKLKRLHYDDAVGPNLRYYEIDFLRAIRPDGSLDERALARLYLNLRDAVNLKIRGIIYWIGSTRRHIDTRPSEEVQVVLRGEKYRMATIYAVK